MKASETSLRNLLEGAKQFQIPLFQRPYSWKKGNWETLWEDLMSLYTAEGKDFYFLGPIVTQSIPGTNIATTPKIRNNTPPNAVTNRSEIRPAINRPPITAIAVQIP